MKAKISIKTRNVNFYKQVAQIFADTSLKNCIGYSADTKSDDAVLVITDGNDMEVFEGNAPLFVISDKLPQGINESASLRWYKRGFFDAEVLKKDVQEWMEIVQTLQNLFTEKEEAKRNEEKYKEKLLDYQKNLQMASKLQEIIMKPALSDKFDVSVCYHPATTVSGDILVAEEVGDSIFVVIGDVTDHGYLAGLYGASLHAAVKGYLSLASGFELNLEGLVRYVQHASSYYQPPGYDALRQKTTATMLFCEINKKEKVVRFVNCGHGNEPPIFVTSKGAQLVSFEENGEILPAIGDFIKKSPQKISECPFVEGDCLVLYTDGITEAFKNANKKKTADGYSTERLLLSVRHEISKRNWSATSVSDGIIKDIESYCICEDIENWDKNSMLKNATDDVTLLVLRWKKEE